MNKNTFEPNKVKLKGKEHNIGAGKLEQPNQTTRQQARTKNQQRRKEGEKNCS